MYIRNPRVALEVARVKRLEVDVIVIRPVPKTSVAHFIAPHSRQWITPRWRCRCSAVRSSKNRYRGRSSTPSPARRPHQASPTSPHTSGARRAPSAAPRAVATDRRGRCPARRRTRAARRPPDTTAAFQRLRTSPRRPRGRDGDGGRPRLTSLRRQSEEITERSAHNCESCLPIG